TEKTIYKYLDGSIAIKIELIPYIAEALKITEQELFLTDKKKKIEFLNNVVKYASKEDLEILNHRIGSRNKIENIYSQTIEKENFTEKKRDSDLERLINLLSFAPKPLVLSLILKLEDLKKYIQNIDKI
ncbi:MAG: hypothetical protein OIF32_00520, partial [Campylobacterales bacterium]|nr:hypothetical protein [Campylobacterales bacterium]